MRKLALCFLVLIALNSCKKAGSGEAPDPSPLLQADREFSSASSKDGWVEAFLEFAHDESVLLRPSAPPIEGRIFLIAYLQEYGDSTSQVTWEPEAAFLAESGELGYTYGIWSLMRADTLLTKGTYVTVWRKDEEGRWKWVLDSGNTGVSEP